MSLKAFHVVFMFFSILILAGFAGWAIRDYLVGSADPLHLAMGIGSGLGSVCLVFYGRWFLRKWKRVSYL